MMTLELALRATEVLLAAALLQQSAEHIFGSQDTRLLFIPRAVLSLVLLTGLYSNWVLLALSVHSLLILHRYQGPYNGGSDRMGLLILYCLCLSRWLPDGISTEAAFGYLAVQVILSYFISGQVKIVNTEWRNGRALQDVFSFSTYPVSESLRALADRPRLLWSASWAVMLFEVLFPLSILNSTVLILALIAAAAFHVANAWLFGLNRFVWFWIAAYPSILWLQTRLIPNA
ncbi:HTTM domain-containing protein [Roseobacter sp.]|uniref:HTTM domain-containing protein n=1 Tax=Roseobacter sp. TaxID=1907202 RepID=UPI00385F5E08